MAGRHNSGGLFSNLFGGGRNRGRHRLVPNGSLLPARSHARTSGAHRLPSGNRGSRYRQPLSQFMTPRSSWFPK